MSSAIIKKWLRALFNENVDAIYEPEEDVRRTFNVPRGVSACDRVFHIINCDLILVEDKSRAGVRKALNQLKAFAWVLRSRNYNIRRYIIVMKNMPKSEAKRYKRERKERYLSEVRGGSRKIVKIFNKPVHLLLRRELNESLDRWFD